MQLFGPQIGSTGMHVPFWQLPGHIVHAWPKRPHAAPSSPVTQVSALMQQPKQLLLSQRSPASRAERQTPASQ